MDRGAWQGTAHWVAKSEIGLCAFCVHFVCVYVCVCVCVKNRETRENECDSRMIRELHLSDFTAKMEK